MHEALASLPSIIFKLEHSSTWEVEEPELKMEGQPKSLVQSEFKAVLSYIKMY